MLVPAPVHFEPTWESLRQNRTPEWFRDAKFGMWAHWGPQSVPERGDWEARWLYGDHPGLDDWEHPIAKGRGDDFRARYGHPSTFGYKDVIHLWHAEKFDADAIVRLYKSAGAKYFVSMGAHSDNFDLWDSRFQPWNAVSVGPRRNILGEFERAARRHGLKFGVSLHSNWAWRWMWTASQSDESGPLKGLSYDGNLTKADGKGTWWEGLDPRDLYLRPRTAAESMTDEGADPSFVQNWKARALDVIDRYRPDLLYLDWADLPFKRTGLEIAAHFYNENAKRHGGFPQAVLNIKSVPDENRDAAVLDVERGGTDSLQSRPWQTDTCIGNWFYAKDWQYKSAAEVVHMLADIVSKNGNLLLNIPLKPDGTLDDREIATVEGIGKWMATNGEAIYNTRPWKAFGEGPTRARAGMFSEGAKFTPQDVRFTTKGDRLYAIFLGWPGETATVHAFADVPVKRVRLLGHENGLKWTQDADGLHVAMPKVARDSPAYSLEIH